MESWFARMGDEFNGETPKSKRRRVAQLHLSCPVGSVAGKFIGRLEEAAFWDEERLKKALIDHFYDGEREDQVDEDVLATISTLTQGRHDVFRYSHKVLKLLQRMPNGMQHYDNIVIGYYLDGLTSQRLRELATLSFRKRDTRETPFHVVKDVMRLATQLKFKGYRMQGSKLSDGEDEDADEDDDGDDDNDDDNATYTADIDSGSGEEGDYDGNRQRMRKVGKMGKARRECGRKNKGRSSKERRNRKSHGNEDETGAEVRELREMVKDLVRLQKAAITPGTGVVAQRPEAEVIPLDTYAVGESYGRYPYGQPDSGLSTTRRSEYPERRSQVAYTAGYRQLRREGYPAAYGRGQDVRRAPPPTHSYFEEFSRGPTHGSQLAQAGNGQLSEGPLTRVDRSQPTPPPIISSRRPTHYLARPPICYHCQEAGHIRPLCPQLYGTTTREKLLGPEHPDTLFRTNKEASAQPHGTPVKAIELVTRSSALEGIKVREVTATTVENHADLKRFVYKIGNASGRDSNDVDSSEEEEEEEEEEAAPVMAGEKARRFSELSPEFGGETGPATQRRKADESDDVVEVIQDGRRVKQPVSKVSRKPIRMMAGREKFDFVGAFREAPVTGLSWVSFFDLVPSVKRDICHLLVQERAKGLNKGKGKGKGKAKKVTIEEVEEEALAVATDRDLGDVVNFYTKGIIRTEEGSYRISRILVDAGSVVNLMPIHLLRFIGAKLCKAGGMVIWTATNALAKIAYCADVRITIAGVLCDLRVYALPEEYKPTYPLLLSRRWLQAVKAKGDYASSQYYIMHHHGTRVRIPRDRSAQISPQRHRPRVPIVMRDTNAQQREMSSEVEEELEWQRSGGSRFFENLVELIKKQAKEQIKYENEEEEDGLSDGSEN